MNPVLPLLYLIPLLIAVVVGGIWLSWKSTASAAPKLRRRLISLRGLALILLATFLINPGRWEALSDETQKIWVTLVDTSRSMSVAVGADDDSSRADSAKALVQSIAEHAETSDIGTRTFTFSDTAREHDGDSFQANGETSDLSTSADHLLSSMSAQGVPLAGVVVLSDGRQTKTPKNAQFTLRAQALGVPFHTVPIGGRHASQDLDLLIPRKTITVFPNQNVQIPIVIKSLNLDEITSKVTLKNEKGKDLAEDEITIASNDDTLHTFSVPAPESSSTWTVHLPQHPDEMRTSNNQTEVHIRVLKNKARIFLAEGAPYWDSKFLAQLLRQQEYMDVHSVHRLSDSRWFRVDSGESSPHQSGVDVFPDTLEKLKAYDLIIFGKNSEHFITPERAANLRAFVKDQGGAVLFARSKPYSGRLPEIEALEPVAWTTGLMGDFKLRPSADGQAAGLFGQALPAADSTIWNALPELKDAHRIDLVKPFTRVLAHGQLPGQSPKDKFPLLMVRRYGQGVSGLVNADGLWKWDFYPDARELGNMYHEYWIQFIYWMISYSEFLPGQDFALNVSPTSVQPGTPVSIRMAYRGENQPEELNIVITSPQLAEPIILSPAQTPSADSSLKWSASFTPEKAGNYSLRLTGPKGSLPDANLSVLPPPSEMDELSADPDFLTRLAESTGGELVPVENFKSFLNSTLKKETPKSREHGVKWIPFWMKWYLPFILVGLLGTEWFLRRRSGLI